MRIGLAFLFSFTLPGLGQLYAGRPLRALAFFLAMVVGAFLFLTGVIGRTFTTGVAIIGFCAVIWIASAIDAAILEWRRVEEPAGYQRWWVMLLIVVVLIPITGAMRDSVQVLRNHAIPTVGMSPTLQPGDIFVMAMDAFEDRPPRVGEIVVFRSPQTGTLLVKRVAAGAGDQVEIRHRQSPPVVTPKLPLATVAEPAPGIIVVPKREIFVVGDNYGNSRDSRWFGTVPLDAVTGAALYILWSDDRDRIGSSLRLGDAPAPTAGG